MLEKRVSNSEILVYNAHNDMLNATERIGLMCEQLLFLWPLEVFKLLFSTFTLQFTLCQWELYDIQTLLLDVFVITILLSS
jgi:hypothetical protein